MTTPSEVTACLERKVGDWFAGQGRRAVPDRKALRQMNMALALVLSRWLELESDGRGPDELRAWLERVAERAERRRATARADAFRRGRAWLDECAGGPGRDGVRRAP